jgi:uncharacterized protein YjbJ (UPF0337 family)
MVRLPNGMEGQMGKLIDRTRGAANEAAGRLKQAHGKISGNAGREAEGLAQQLKGKAQKIKGTIKGRWATGSDRAPTRRNGPLAGGLFAARPGLRMQPGNSLVPSALTLPCRFDRTERAFYGQAQLWSMRAGSRA